MRDAQDERLAAVDVELELRCAAELGAAVLRAPQAMLLEPRVVDWEKRYPLIVRLRRRLHDVGQMLDFGVAEGPAILEAASQERVQEQIAIPLLERRLDLRLLEVLVVAINENHFR